MTDVDKRVKAEIEDVNGATVPIKKSKKGDKNQANQPKNLRIMFLQFLMDQIKNKVQQER